MNNPANLHKIPLFIEQLAEAGYILDIELSKGKTRITYKRNAFKNRTISFWTCLIN
jgi:hypothetical protein